MFLMNKGVRPEKKTLYGNYKSVSYLRLFECLIYSNCFFFFEISMVKYPKFERMCMDTICTCAPAQITVEWIFSEQREIDWLDELLKFDELVIKAMGNCASCTQGSEEKCVCEREYLSLEASLPESERPHPHLSTYEEKEQALRELVDERDKCSVCAAIK